MHDSGPDLLEDSPRLRERILASLRAESAPEPVDMLGVRRRRWAILASVAVAAASLALLVRFFDQQLGRSEGTGPSEVAMQPEFIEESEEQDSVSDRGGVREKQIGGFHDRIHTDAEQREAGGSSEGKGVRRMEEKLAGAKTASEYALGQAQEDEQRARGSRSGDSTWPR